MYNKNRLIFFLLVATLLLASKSVLCQEWNSARISVLSGGAIPFNFNSLQKIRNGIEIQDGLILGITLTDNNEAGHDLEGFVLNFRAFNSQTNLQGDANTLPLNRIRIKALSYKGLDSGYSYGYTDLSSGWQPLFSFNNTLWSNLDWSNHQISVSFECGKPTTAGGNGSLLGEPSDYYQVEIEFELVPTGPGF